MGVNTQDKGWYTKAMLLHLQGFTESSPIQHSTKSLTVPWHPSSKLSSPHTVPSELFHGQSAVLKNWIYISE